MSNYTNVTIGQADTSGALTGVDIQGSSPQGVNLVIASLRQPVDREGDITDAQFAETVGASAVAKFTVFGSQDGIARFVEYVMAYNATVADELVD